MTALPRPDGQNLALLILRLIGTETNPTSTLYAYTASNEINNLGPLAQRYAALLLRTNKRTVLENVTEENRKLVDQVNHIITSYAPPSPKQRDNYLENLGQIIDPSSNQY